GRAVGLLRASGGASMEVTEPGADRVDGFLQLVVAGGNLLFESLIEATAAVDGLLEQVFQPMAEVAQVVEIGQTGTALEGMQCPQQVLGMVRVLRIPAPVRE